VEELDWKWGGGDGMEGESLDGKEGDSNNEFDEKNESLPPISKAQELNNDAFMSELGEGCDERRRGETDSVRWDEEEKEDKDRSDKRQGRYI
jgi:hypothetical protein